MKKGRKLAPVVAILNLKGGVGKTTVSAHVFRVLFQKFRAGTLLVDLDPQFNLTQTLLTRTKYENLRKEGKTVLSAMEPPPAVGLFQIKTSATPPPLPDEISVKLWFFAKLNPEQKLAIVPGDFNLVKYSLMDDNRKLVVVRKRFINFIQLARKDFKVICIDCNPSSSFLTLCALHACTHILVPVRPDKYSILGLELLSDFVDSIPSIKPKPDIVVLLNGIPRSNYVATIENELRSHPVFGARTLANKLYQSSLLVAHPDYTGFATDKRVPYKQRLKREITDVVDELAGKLGFV